MLVVEDKGATECKRVDQNVQVRIYIYAKTQVRNNLDQKYGQFGWILDLRVQNVCVEAILISVNPMLTEFVMPLFIIYHYQECVYLGKRRRP